MEPVFGLRDVQFFYGKYQALRDVTFDIGRNEITALIGPSGCGKSTLLRCLNRMNDLIPGARMEGRLEYRGEDLYAPGVNPIEVRRRIGMVFQKPNPFPKSIYDNVAFGPESQRVPPVRAGRHRGGVAASGPPCGTRSRTSSSSSAFALSGGQQQRLCIARAIAVKPDVILMDEPCSRPRPDRHHPHRGAHDRAQAGLHDRRRDPQHAAGGAGVGPDRLLHRRGRRPRRRATASWSRSTGPTASSPTPPTSAPTTTSPAASADPTASTGRSVRLPRLRVQGEFEDGVG